MLPDSCLSCCADSGFLSYACCVYPAWLATDCIPMCSQGSSEFCECEPPTHASVPRVAQTSPVLRRLGPGEVSFMLIAAVAEWSAADKAPRIILENPHIPVPRSITNPSTRYQPPPGPQPSTPSPTPSPQNENRKNKLCYPPFLSINSFASLIFVAR